MGSAIALREDFSGPGLRRLATASRDAARSRRLLAVAEIHDGGALGCGADRRCRASGDPRLGVAVQRRRSGRPDRPRGAGSPAQTQRRATPGAHAVLILDQAARHATDKLAIPANITLLPLPPRSPELNPVENIGQFMRDDWLSDRVFKSYDDIVAPCREAWNTLIDPKELEAASLGFIASFRLIPDRLGRRRIQRFFGCSCQPGRLATAIGHSPPDIARRPDRPVVRFNWLRGSGCRRRRGTRRNARRDRDG